MSDRRYQLIDFGRGRKLESLGGHLVSRPSPAANDDIPTTPAVWRDAASIFDASHKAWAHRSPWPDDLRVDCDGFVMPVQPTPFGHIGLFPEQAENWRWLRSDGVPASSDSEPAKALNLFAYTGASSMALLSAGFAVAHVDAAKANVMAARRAAEANGWQDAPVRYLVDDAAKFCAREVRRGNRYHTIVLDPPAFGHSPKGKTWRLERDLWPLLDDVWRIKTKPDFRILVTGHSTGVDQEQITAFFEEKQFRRGGLQLRLQSGRSELTDTVGRKLDAGFYVRVNGRVSE
ncbi:class I SAM-dependent methyltransferase [Stieleria varia]|uniref:23S rRNA m(2)G2445 methyltransferase n=1 Tax=Stieleria varia TaxID=2528005 RepID=A0A5C6ASH7_9BACT|nr:class I SAM-dependent methyltransferase [Stieleria varia]TWU02441.1 23S rRNA m(2)G2445 methyltransferase [Stieleria varia]